MNDDTAFLNQIADDPFDMATHGVYADWLEENGEIEKAEFLRTRSRLIDSEPTDVDTWRQLTEQLAHLRRIADSSWVDRFIVIGQLSSPSDGVHLVEMGPRHLIEPESHAWALRPHWEAFVRRVGRRQALVMSFKGHSIVSSATLMNLIMTYKQLEERESKIFLCELSVEAIQVFLVTSLRQPLDYMFNYSERLDEAIVKAKAFVDGANEA